MTVSEFLIAILMGIVFRILLRPFIKAGYMPLIEDFTRKFCILAVLGMIVVTAWWGLKALLYIRWSIELQAP